VQDIPSVPSHPNPMYPVSISAQKILSLAGERSMAKIARKIKLPGATVSQLIVFESLTVRSANAGYKKMPDILATTKPHIYLEESR